AAPTTGTPPLVVSGLSLGARFNDISFASHGARILALFGQVGSGADDVVRSLAGLAKPTGGTAVLNGAELPLGTHAATKRLGVTYVPADRATEGVFLNASVTDNISSGALNRVSRWWVLDRGREHELAAREAVKVRFSTTRLGENVQAFSG